MIDPAAPIASRWAGHLGPSLRLLIREGGALGGAIRRGHPGRWAGVAGGALAEVVAGAVLQALGVAEVAAEVSGEAPGALEEAAAAVAASVEASVVGCVGRWLRAGGPARLGAGRQARPASQMAAESRPAGDGTASHAWSGMRVPAAGVVAGRAAGLQCGSSRREGVDVAARCRGMPTKGVAAGVLANAQSTASLADLAAEASRTWMAPPGRAAGGAAAAKSGAATTMNRRWSTWLRSAFELPTGIPTVLPTAGCGS